MTNCFLDPIFLAINDSISVKHFSNVLYPIIYDFLQKIEEIEKQSNQRAINFNVTFEFIRHCMKYNPFRFSSNISCSKWFNDFFSKFLKTHRNSNCGILSNDNDIELQYNYMNRYVPLDIMNDWNKFLNNCSTCCECKEKKKDLLSHETLGIRLCENSLVFFNNIIYDFISWFDQQDFSSTIQTQPTEVEIQPELKKKGNWSHSHPKIVMSEIDKFLNFRYISEIRPIGNTRGVNRNEIRVYSFNDYKIFISDKNGAQMFSVITSARNEFEGELVLKKISKQFPNYKIKT